MQIHYDVRKLISDMNQRDFEEEHKQQCCFPRVPSVVSKKTSLLLYDVTQLVTLHMFTNIQIHQYIQYQ